MRYSEAETDSGIDPIYISVKQAAKALGISPWSTYVLCNEKKIDSRYEGRRRLVSVRSLRDYAAAMPTEPASA